MSNIDVHPGVNPRGWAVFGAVVLLMLTAAMPARAEQRKPDAANQALRKAQGMLREMNLTLTALQTEKAGLEDQVTKLAARVKELEGLQDQVRQQKASLDGLHSSNEQLQSRLGAEAQRFETLTARQRATQEQLGRFRQDNALLVQAVTERTQWVKTCGEKNAGLLKANRELLQKYQDKGLWSVLSAEPFTGVGAVAEENAAQDFRFKLEDLQVTPWRDSDTKTGGNAEPAEAGKAAQGDASAEDEDQ
ncbi:MAG: uncharacterized protein H6R26_2659 [Proteobacteria bacterium]|nr:uncharacterized protein [Pseudomonadota bacterium]